MENTLQNVYAKTKKYLGEIGIKDYKIPRGIIETWGSRALESLKLLIDWMKYIESTSSEKNTVKAKQSARFDFMDFSTDYTKNYD